MESYLVSFIHAIFAGFVALFPPVNPLGSAIIVEPFIKRLSAPERLKAAAMIASYCFTICVIVSLFGGMLFSFFGISIPVVQLAGGFLICKLGLESLSPTPKKDEEKEVAPNSVRDVQGMLFYPLAFPTTTGGGTISVLLALSANNFGNGHDAHIIEQLALVLASFLMCFTVFVCYYFAPTILSRLSEQGHQVVDRLSGFLMFCVGLQIFVNGAMAIWKLHN